MPIVKAATRLNMWPSRLSLSLNVSNLRRPPQMVRSTLRSLARRYRSVLHETSGGSAQSYRPSTCRPAPVILRARAAPKPRRCFAAQTAEHPRQVFLMREAARQGDLGNRAVGLGQQAPGALDAAAHQVLMGRAAG